jgi:hypothetical protein
MTDAEIVAAWQSKLPSMDAGAALDQKWVNAPPLAGVFGPPWTAPVARTGHDKRLAMAIEEWARA